MNRVSMTQLVSRIKLTRETGNFRTDAALAAASAFGQSVSEEHLLVNAGALANSLGAHPVVYTLTPEAIELIGETDLHSLPGNPPLLLNSALIVTGTDRALFGGTIDLGVYPVPDGGYGLLGMDAEAGEFFLWRPTWKEREITLGDDIPVEPGADAKKISAFGRDAIRFLLVFSLLLEADKTPIEIHTNKLRQKKSVSLHQATLGRGEWTVSRISLTTRPVSQSSETMPVGKEVEGRILSPTTVSGHLAYQAYGKQWSLRRWIYIEAYEARRWVAPGPRRIVVDK